MHFKVRLKIFGGLRDGLGRHSF